MFTNYALYYDLFNYDKPYKKEIKFVYDWAGKPTSIYDIGCGTCNYWKYFPKKVKIDGIDSSIDMQTFNNDRGLVVCQDVCDLNIETSGVRYDCATALFDVINYIPNHDWWKEIPIKKGGYFIFDIWDTEKIKRDGFSKTIKTVAGATRIITPICHDESTVRLKIEFNETGSHLFEENHTMYLYGYKDILRFCGKEFKIVDVKPTDRWQTWYKLKRK